jgi:hypothetical protein
MPKAEYTPFEKEIIKAFRIAEEFDWYRLTVTRMKSPGNGTPSIQVEDLTPDDTGK